jgi:hypothetical protein
MTVPYETAAPSAYRWTTTAYDYLEDGTLSARVEKAGGIRTAVVSGDCPHCQDNVNFSQVLDGVSGESRTTAGGKRFTRGAKRFTRDAGFVELTVTCCCTEPHEGRPADVSHGCGINFRVDVAPDAQ